MVSYPTEIIAHWKLDEATGNALDSYGTYELTENGTVPSDTGIIDDARGVYSTSNYFNWPASGSSATVFDNQKFAVEGWFKTSATGILQPLLNKEAISSNVGWMLAVDTNNKLHWYVNNASLASTSTYNDGAWHYFYFAVRETSGAAEIRCYIDGVIDSNMTNSGVAMTGVSSDLRMGRRTVNTDILNGLLDDTAYWDLTSTTKSWTDIEAIITERYAAGAGAGYGEEDSVDYLYDEINYFQSGGIENSTDLILYDFGSSTDIYRIDIDRMSFVQEGATLTAVLTGDVITSVTVTDGGRGFNNATLTVTGDGTGASLTPVLDDSGTITSVTVNDGGSGYTTATVTVNYDDPTGTVSSYVSADGSTWTKLTDYDVSTTEINGLDIIDSSYRYFKLATTDSIATELKIFSMIAYSSVSANTEAKLEDFVFNLDQKYVLVLRGEAIDVYEDDVFQETVVATGMLASYLDTIKTTQAEDTMILTHPDMKTKQLVRSFASQAYTNDPAAGSDIVLTMTDTSNFTIGDVVKVSSSAGSENATITDLTTNTSIEVDSLTLNHTTTLPLVTSTTVVEWTFEDFPWINIPKDAFGLEATTQPAQTLTPSATEGSIKLTAGGGSIFSEDSVGQLIDAGENGGGRVRITSYESATVVYGYTIIPFYTTAAIASGDWDYITGYEDAWSETRGYPTTCLFYQQRLWLGGSKSKPNTVWASRVGQFDNFENVANYDNDAINETISSDQIDEIVNLYANRGIQIFTAGAEWIIPEGATEPSTISFTKNTSNGSLANISPIDISGTTMFIEKNGKSMLSFVYTDSQAAYTTESMSLLTDLVNNPVGIAVDYNSSQDVGNFLYMVLADGTMAVWCIVLSQKIVSPVRFETDGLIKDVVNVAGDTYILVERASVLYLEKLADVKTDFTTTDSSLSASITGLTEYNGLDVRVYNDDTDFGTYNVSNGAITLTSTPTATVYIGLVFDYALTSTKIAVNGQTENIEKRIAKATVVTKDTPTLTFCTQTLTQDDDVYDFYAVTSFDRDCRFTVTGSFNYVEILSILLNINYGDK